MNLSYWRKTLILKLTNSVYKFNNNNSETEKGGIKTTYWGGKECWHVSTWSKFKVLAEP